MSGAVKVTSSGAFSLAYDLGGRRWYQNIRKGEQLIPRRIVDALKSHKRIGAKSMIEQLEEKGEIKIEPNTPPAKAEAAPAPSSKKKKATEE